MIVLQATIGIDFLSKTMYLEDRTVSLNYDSHHSHCSSFKKLRACICFVCSSHRVLPFHHFTMWFYIILDFTIHFVIDHVFSSHCFHFHSIFFVPYIPLAGSWNPPISTLILGLATDSATALGYSRTGTLPQPHPQLHPRLSCCCGGLWYSQ